MAQAKADPQNIELKFWTEEMSVSELRTAYRKVNSWVVLTPTSNSLWYSTVLGNLTCQYIPTNDATIERVRSSVIQGLDNKAFDRLKTITALSSEELGRVIRIPARTLARRTIFKPNESERILRVASIFQRTIEVLGDLEKAREWFSSPKRALGGETPIQFCDTEPGAQEVMNLLGRIEHGVFT